MRASWLWFVSLEKSDAGPFGFEKSDAALINFLKQFNSGTFGLPTPYAFTEQGVAMLSSILSSPQAVQVNIAIMRAFVKLRELAMTHHDLAKQLNALEEKTETMTLQHDTFARSTRAQLKQVFDAIRELMTPPEPQKKRPIGFITGDEQPKKND